MNLRNVLRTYALLRQLSDDESALLATLREMSDSERELLVESLQPEKQGSKKKRTRSAGKSPRASNIAATLGKNLAQQREATNGKCLYVFENGEGGRCLGDPDDPIHDPTMGYSGYHEFVASITQAAGGR